MQRTGELVCCPKSSPLSNQRAFPLCPLVTLPRGSPWWQRLCVTALWVLPLGRCDLYLFMYYLFWLRRVSVAACRLLVAAHMRDLVPWPGIEPGPPASGARSLTHWTTREVPLAGDLNSVCSSLRRLLQPQSNGPDQVVTGRKSTCNLYNPGSELSKGNRVKQLGNQRMHLLGPPLSPLAVARVSLLEHGKRRRTGWGGKGGLHPPVVFHTLWQHPVMAKSYAGWRRGPSLVAKGLEHPATFCSGFPGSTWSPTTVASPDQVLEIQFI